MLSSQTQPSTAPALPGVQLAERGFVVLPGPYGGPAAAWAGADAVLRAAAADDDLCRRFPPLDVVADYTMPPPGAGQRAFQVLHLDFGLPLALAPRVDVARYTVLHVDRAAAGSGAATRIVPLTALARQRRWPTPAALVATLRGRADDPDVAEGVLARIVEAADGAAALPAKTRAGFRCGLEFDRIEAEYAYFAGHGIDLRAVERQIVLAPGQVLIFDNLGCAHGRLGLRATRELHQHCVGFAAVTQDGQHAILRHVLTGLTRPA